MTQRRIKRNSGQSIEPLLPDRRGKIAKELQKLVRDALAFEQRSGRDAAWYYLLGSLDVMPSRSERIVGVVISRGVRLGYIVPVEGHDGVLRYIWNRAAPPDVQARSESEGWIAVLYKGTDPRRQRCSLPRRSAPTWRYRGPGDLWG